MLTRVKIFLDIPGLSVSHFSTQDRGTEDPDLISWLRIHGADKETINRVGNTFLGSSTK